jgi:hypothetical protein
MKGKKQMNPKVQSNCNECGIKTTSFNFARMLDKDVAEKLKRFHTMHSMQDGNCLLRYSDHGPKSEKNPIIPYAPFERFRVYTGTRQTGSYNHHPQIAKFKGKYYFAWSNGIVDEENTGQRILVACSDDASRWSSPICVAGDTNDPVSAYNCVALYPTSQCLYVIGMKEDMGKDATLPGMRRIEPNSHQVSVYASKDGVSWGKVFDFTNNLKLIFEAPRQTANGHLLVSAAMKDGPAFLQWPGKELCEHPKVISIKEPEGAHFPYGESTWYQTDDGTIVVFWRDEGRSCRVWVNYSTDNGETFNGPMISDIPDSMSRLYAGRLKDGRYYLCNNAFPTLLNRMHLMLLLSDNGYQFNKAYILVDDPTSQRLTGLLKTNGYQYPCCLPDNDKLLVGYSVNKEDIECGIVDVAKL